MWDSHRQESRLMYLFLQHAVSNRSRCWPAYNIKLPCTVSCVMRCYIWVFPILFYWISFPRLSHVKTGLLTLNQHIPRTSAGEQRRQPQTRTTTRSIVINTDDSEEMPPVTYLRIASNGNPHLHSCHPLTSRPPRCYNPWPTSRHSNYFSIPRRESEHPSPQQPSFHPDPHPSADSTC